jgi:hypothetical protein
MKKSIHLIPTDKPSRLAFLHDDNLHIGTNFKKGLNVNTVNVYITSDEEIKEGDYFYSPFQGEERILKYNKFVIPFPKDKKIIITTDEVLIADGVQAIPNDFLEWFVQNPSCQYGGYKDIAWDQIITLKEEPKQELTSVIPQEQNTISFMQDNAAREILKLCENGDIFVKGKLAENDIEVVDALREFLKGQGFLK